MKRRTFLQAAIAASVAAMVPELPASPSVVITGSVTGPHVVPLEVIGLDEWGHSIAWKCWHINTELNKEWCALLDAVK